MTGADKFSLRFIPGKCTAEMGTGSGQGDESITLEAGEEKHPFGNGFDIARGKGFYPAPIDIACSALLRLSRFA